MSRHPTTSGIDKGALEGIWGKELRTTLKQKRKKKTEMESKTQNWALGSSIFMVRTDLHGDFI